jgi:hypothetical protein
VGTVVVSLGVSTALAGSKAVILLSRLAIPAVIWLAVAALILLVSQSGRALLLALALQYIAVFALVALSWPLPLAAVKWVAGWMAALVLAITARGLPATWAVPQQNRPSGILFRWFAASLVFLVIASLVPHLAAWMPGVHREQVWGGLIGIGIGLLHLGLTARPLRVVLGTLTVLSGFEILYAAVESAALVAGLLAALNLGLALVGAYLLVSPNLEDAG